MGGTDLAIAVAGPPGSLAFSSCHLTERGTLPCADSAPVAEYRAWLLAMLNRRRPEAFMCFSDGGAAAMNALRDELPVDVTVALPGRTAFEAAEDKGVTLSVARALGVAVPTGRVLSDPGEISSYAVELGFPVVIKPTRSWQRTGEPGARAHGRRLSGALVQDHHELQTVSVPAIRCWCRSRRPEPGWKWPWCAAAGDPRMSSPRCSSSRTT
ncbi:hypothetical protein LFM09_15845 [Lentzea alba]|uniref:hypothetical protein n=1 Tax=Lentzea alba TaxID=2714351 RepID=UPI0039BF2A4E